MVQFCSRCNEPLMTGELIDYIRQLTKGEAVWTPGDDPAVADLSAPADLGGPIHEIEPEVFYWHGYFLPPRWRWGCFFCVADGLETFRFFWAFNHHFYVRRLTGEQTREFCRLAGLTIHDLY